MTFSQISATAISQTSC